MAMAARKRKAHPLDMSAMAGDCSIRSRKNVKVPRCFNTLITLRRCSEKKKRRKNSPANTEGLFETRVVSPALDRPPLCRTMEFSIADSQVPSIAGSQVPSIANSHGPKSKWPKGKQPKAKGAQMKGPKTTWTDAATSFLIEKYSEAYAKVNCGNLRQKDWLAVLAKFNDMSVPLGYQVQDLKQLQYRIDNLKKRYKSEKEAQDAIGGTPSDWKWFEAIDTILHDDPKHCGIINAMDGGSPVNRDTSNNMNKYVLLDDEVTNDEQDNLIILDDEVSNPATNIPEPAANMESATVTLDSANMDSTTPSGVKMKIAGPSKKKKKLNEEGDLAGALREFSQTFKDVAAAQRESSAKVTIEMVKLLLSNKET